MENIRCDGMLLYDDQVCELIDLLIGRDSVRLMYLQRQDRSWIRMVGDPDLRDGLLNLTETQIRIIEATCFEGAGVMELRSELHLTVSEIRKEVSDMRETLRVAM